MVRGDPVEPLELMVWPVFHVVGGTLLAQNNFATSVRSLLEGNLTPPSETLFTNGLHMKMSKVPLLVG